MHQVVDPKISGQAMKVMVDNNHYTKRMFNSFCTRMWLDYCDENNDPLSAPNRLDKDEYVEKYNDWLWEKFKED